MAIVGEARADDPPIADADFRERELAPARCSAASPWPTSCSDPERREAPDPLRLDPTYSQVFAGGLRVHAPLARLGRPDDIADAVLFLL